LVDLFLDIKRTTNSTGNYWQRKEWTGSQHLRS